MNGDERETAPRGSFRRWLAGEMGLGFTFWVTGILPSWHGGLVAAKLLSVSLSTLEWEAWAPRYAANMLLLSAVSLFYCSFMFFAVWRAASRHGGFWGVVARVWVAVGIGVLGVLCFGMIVGLLSKRWLLLIAAVAAAG